MCGGLILTGIRFEMYDCKSLLQCSSIDIETMCVPTRSSLRKMLNSHRTKLHDRNRRPFNVMTYRLIRPELFPHSTKLDASRILRSGRGVNFQFKFHVFIGGGPLQGMSTILRPGHPPAWTELGEHESLYY